MVHRERFLELKRRLTSGQLGLRSPVEARESVGVPALDRLLGGGFPSGALATLEGGPSSGRWSIAVRMLAQATRRGLAAVIDEGELYPPDLERAGVRLDRLLVVRARSPLALVRAADLLVRSRIARVIVMPAPVLRAALWMRLAGLAYRSGIVLLVIAPAHAAPELTGAANLRLGCALDRVLLCGSRGVWCMLAGFDVRVEIRKYKRTASDAHAYVRAVTMHEGVPVRERAIGRAVLSAVGER